MPWSVHCVFMGAGQDLDVAAEAVRPGPRNDRGQFRVIQSGVARAAGHRLQRPSARRVRRAPYERELRSTSCDARAQAGLAVPQPGRHRRFRDDASARDGCKRRPHRAREGTSSRSGNICAGARALCPRHSDDHSHGCHSENVVDARPASRARDACGASKGRIQEGADADIVVFDARTIADRATYDKPAEASVGVRYLLVGGTVIVDQGAVVTGVAPGRALLRGRKGW